MNLGITSNINTPQSKLNNNQKINFGMVKGEKSVINTLSQETGIYFSRFNENYSLNIARLMPNGKLQTLINAYPNVLMHSADYKKILVAQNPYAEADRLARTAEHVTNENLPSVIHNLKRNQAEQSSSRLKELDLVV